MLQPFLIRLLNNSKTMLIAKQIYCKYKLIVHVSKHAMPNHEDNSGVILDIIHLSGYLILIHSIWTDVCQ